MENVWDFCPWISGAKLRIVEGRQGQTSAATLIRKTAYLILLCRFEYVCTFHVLLGIYTKGISGCLATYEL